MAKIKLDREKCIGCGSCVALCDKYFETAEDGKSHLKNTDKKELKEIEVEKVECAEAAAQACPAQCIYIEK